MKKLQRISALLVALLVLISGNGWAISVHICENDHKTETNLFSRTEGCCSEKLETDCSGTKQGITTDCCFLKVNYYKAEIPSSGSSKKMVVSAVGISLPPAVLSFNLFSADFQVVSLHSYPPNLQRLHALFLPLII